MQHYPLLATKLFRPSPNPSLVSRSRLLQQLEANFGPDDTFKRKLTLVSAPAGFGKTTLITEWLEARKHTDTPCNATWLSLDEGDSDPVRFLHYVIAAMRQIEGLDNDFGKGVLSMLQAPQRPSWEIIVTPLINALAKLNHCVMLVLDDLHLVEGQAVYDILGFFIDYMPEHMHLLLITRIDPPLSLSRLRARQKLTELRATDLRFTREEIRSLIRSDTGGNLSEEHLSALEQRTEGWIAGLQLAVLSMRNAEDVSAFLQSFTGSHRFVLDYLLEEVLSQQPDTIQTFLLKTSILNRMNGDLCDAVTGQHDGRNTLEMLERANLFIVPLDNERRWYRYHHLFADLLRQRLRQKQPGQVSSLHRSASDWYACNGYNDEAVEYALFAKDFERAISLVERVAEDEWMQARHAKLQRWFDSVPSELVLSRPQLCIFQAWNLFGIGKPDAAEQHLRAAEKALTSNTNGTTTVPVSYNSRYADVMQLQGRIAVIRGCMAFFRGDVPEIIKLSSQAIECLPRSDLWRSTAIITLGDAHFVKGEIAEAYEIQLQALKVSKEINNTFMILMASLKLAITLRQLGRLYQVIEICKQQMQFANENGLTQTIAMGWAQAILGEVLAEIGDLDSAIPQAKKGVELTSQGGDVGILGSSYLYLTRVLFTSGDMIGAEQAIQEMAQIARETFVPPWIMNLVMAWQPRIWLSQDNLDAAVQWMQERGLGTKKAPTFLYEMEYGIVSARVFMAQGRLDEAISYLNDLLEVAEAGGRTTVVIEILTLQALALQSVGDTTRAINVLERAFTIAEPNGYIYLFVDEGPPMASLLYEALSRGIQPAYVQRLLASYPDAPAIAPEPESVNSDALIEPLSDREIEVLKLMAEGLTNPEIAQKLYLSKNTVKVHTRNIYGKLGVNNRTQATQKAQVLGLLPAP